MLSAVTLQIVYNSVKAEAVGMNRLVYNTNGCALTHGLLIGLLNQLQKDRK